MNLNFCFAVGSVDDLYCNYLYGRDVAATGKFCAGGKVDACQVKINSHRPAEERAYGFKKALGVVFLCLTILHTKKVISI